MPRGTYNQKLTDLEILELVDAGYYRVCLDTGRVFSGRTNKQVYTYAGAFVNTGYRKDKNYRWLRLFRSPKYRTLPRSHVIWIVGNRMAIPPGFEVHHDNENRRDDSFGNLYLLSRNDHAKLHRLRRDSLVYTSTPSTPNTPNQLEQELSDAPF